MADNPFHYSAGDLKHGGGGSSRSGSNYSEPTPTTVTKKIIVPINTAQYYTDLYGTGSSSGSAHTSSGGNTYGGGGTSRTGTSSNATVSGNDLQSQLQSLYAQRQAAAQNAYNNSIGALQNAYGQQRSSLENSFNTGRGVLDNSYNNSLSKIDNNAKKTLQESYINKMLTQKNLGQQLAAQGISGGASESAMAGIANNYGNSRNSINDTWNTNRSDLQNTYQNNLAQLIQSYNSDLAQLESNYANQQASLNSNLENGISDSVGDYTSMLMSNPKLFAALTSTQDSMKAYNPIDTVSTNATDGVNTQQNNDMGSATNYAKYKSWIDQYIKNGFDRTSIVRSLGMGGLNQDEIFKVLDDYGYTGE